MDVEALLGILATPAGTAAVAIYFFHKFVSFHNDSLARCMEEQKADRELFREAINKLDVRLSYLEKLIETSIIRRD